MNFDDCPELLDVIRSVAGGIDGVKRVFDESRPSGSEDCTMLIRRVKEHGGRGTYFLFGCNQNGHHRADFDIQDTESLPVAFEVFTGVAKKLNGIAA